MSSGLNTFDDFVSTSVSCFPTMDLNFMLSVKGLGTIFVAQFTFLRETLVAIIMRMLMMMTMPGYTRLNKSQISTGLMLGVVGKLLETE